MKESFYRQLTADSGDKATERLLVVANELFCREGINATGIKKVLDESGVARRTLYERFGSKENLVRAVLERESELWLAWFRPLVLAAGETPKERLLGVFKALKVWFEDEAFFGCAFINAVIENSKRDEGIRGLALLHRERTNAFIRELADAAGARDPHLLAEQLGILMDGAIVSAVTLHSSEPAVHAEMVAKLLIEQATQARR